MYKFDQMTFTTNCWM